MGKKCSQFTDSDFLAFIRGDCEKEKKSALEEHLKNCLTCSVRVEGLKKGAKTLVESLPAPRVPGSVDGRVEKAVMKRFGRPPPLFSMPFWVGGVCAFVLAAVLVFAVVPLLGLKWNLPRPTASTSQTPDEATTTPTQQTPLSQKDKEELLKRMEELKAALGEKSRILGEREAELSGLTELKRAADDALKNATEEWKSLEEKMNEERLKLANEMAKLKADYETLKNDKEALVARLQESELFVNKLGERVSEEEAKVFQMSTQLEEMKKSVGKEEERTKALLQQMAEMRSLMRVMSEEKAEVERRYFAALDLDGDGILSAADSVYLCGKIAAEEGISYNRAADLNSDGKMDVADALLIIKLLEERKKR